MEGKQIKNYLIILGLIALSLAVGTVLTYLWFVDTNPVTGPRKLENFAVFFGGITSPFITLLTIIPLVWTLLHQSQALDNQRAQFQTEQKTQRFQENIQRFREKVSEYEKMASQPVGYREPDDSVILKNVAFIDPHSDEAQRANELIGGFEALLIAAENRDAIPLDSRRDALFLFQLRSLAVSACSTLNYAYKFATPDDFVILYDASETAQAMLFELKAWHVFLNEPLERLKSLTQVPEHLRKA